MKEPNQEKEVLGWFETALARRGIISINLYYKPNCDAFKRLQDKGIISPVHVGRILVGYSYKGYMFTFHEGSGDCEELLYCDGKI